MSSPTLTIELTDSLWDAWQLLSVSGLRHLIVLGRNRESLGVINDRQILAQAPATTEHLGAITVNDFLSQASLTTLHPDDTPQQAAALMRDQGIEALPVCTADGKIAGILTQTDLIRWIS
jgi:CBS domain-containing protein